MSKVKYNSQGEVSKRLKEHDDEIAKMQNLTLLGFVIALLTVFGVVIAAITFFMTETHQINTQTQLIQQMNDKLDTH